MNKGDVTFTVQQVARLTGRPVRTVAYWLRWGILRASVTPPRGRNYQVLLSMNDALEACALVGLRDAGLSMQKCRKLLTRLRKRGERLADHDLLMVTDGGTELVGLRPGMVNAEAMLKHVGQLVMLPARTWREKALQIMEEEETARRRVPVSA